MEQDLQRERRGELCAARHPHRSRGDGGQGAWLGRRGRYRQGRRDVLRCGMRCRLSGDSAGAARRHGGRVGHQRGDGDGGWAAGGCCGRCGSRDLLDERPGGAEREVRHGDVYRRDDPLPAGEDVGDGDAPRLGRRQTADHLLCPRHLVLPRPQEDRRALPRPVQDHARVPPSGGGRRQCADGVGLQDLADGDDGHQLLLLATAGGRARLGGW
mmetsp:Transcript_9513/g.22281  ORF Transcript_9513/g.22281 Transcript_9513/m.22281 type:complete len:213 (-) Transcript_9513:154-792(-)